MRITACLLLLQLVVTRAFAQTPDSSFQKGDHLLNVGIGLNSYYEGGLPLSLSYEKATTDKVSIVFGIDYLHRNYTDLYLGKYSFTAIYLGVRGAFHVNSFLEEIDFYDSHLDIYVGAALGYRYFHWSDSYASYYYDFGGGLYYGAYLGGKYYFTPRISAFMELGATGSTNARVGIGIKL